MTDANEKLQQDLERLGSQIASGPSIASDVMRRIDRTTMVQISGARRIGRRLMKPTIGLAACLAAVVIAWLVILPGSTTPAYGIEDVRDRLLEVKSLHVAGWAHVDACGGDTCRPDEAKGQPQQAPIEYYVQRPNLFCLSNTAETKDGLTGIYRASDGRRYINVDHGDKTCTVGKEVPLATELNIEELLQHQLTGQLVSQPLSDYRFVRNDILDGTEAALYERKIELAITEKLRSEIRLNVWLDPKSGIPVRSAVHRRAGDQPERPVVCFDRIQANVPPPPGMFNFEPPDGYKVIHKDHQEDDIGGVGAVRVKQQTLEIRFAFLVDGRAILVCWALYDESESPPIEDDLAGPVARPLTLQPKSTMGEDVYGHYFVRADKAPRHHWRWSLIVPKRADVNISNDIVSLTFRNRTGGTGSAGILPLVIRQHRLAELIVATQRLTLPADSPPEAVMTLEQIEALIERIRQEEARPQQAGT
jgi:outer membrane lipoprotein-sorting protein